jgi:hypothetical protein
MAVMESVLTCPVCGFILHHGTLEAAVIQRIAGRLDHADELSAIMGTSFRHGCIDVGDRPVDRHRHPRQQLEIAPLE